MTEGDVSVLSVLAQKALEVFLCFYRTEMLCVGSGELHWLPQVASWASENNKHLFLHVTQTFIIFLQGSHRTSIIFLIRAPFFSFHSCLPVHCLHFLIPVLCVSKLFCWRANVRVKVFGHRMCFLMLKVQHKELKELSATVEIRESREC